MKKCLFFAMLLVTVQVFGQKQVIQDANAEARKVSDFQAIEVSSSVELHISQGPAAVAVSAPDDIRRDVVTEVNNGVLEIKYKGRSYRNKSRIRVYLSTTKLNRIGASGACDVNINGEFKAEDLSIRLSGASDVRGTVVCNNLKLDCSGASDVSLKGSADDLNIDLSGASQVKSYDLVVDNCRIEASGASDVELTINKMLNASASGASNIYFKGEGQIGDIRASGASHITKR